MKLSLALALAFVIHVAFSFRLGPRPSERAVEQTNELMARLLQFEHFLPHIRALSVMHIDSKNVADSQVQRQLTIVTMLTVVVFVVVVAVAADKQKSVCLGMEENSGHRAELRALHAASLR